LVKGATALVSAATAVVVWPIIPRVLALPSPAMLRTANDRLEAEIAERRRSEAKLTDALQRLGRHMDNTPLGVVELACGVDAGEPWRIQSWFGQAKAIFGWTAVEAVGHTVEDLTLIYHRDLHKVEVVRRDLLERHKPGIAGILRCCTKSGEVRQCRVYASLVHTPEGRPDTVLLLIEDVTGRLATEHEARRLAYHDTLTGLPNRLLFRDRLKQALARTLRERERVAVALLDLDHFKEVNDSLGHPAGDRLLGLVAERLAGVLRSSDTLARARRGRVRPGPTRPAYA
jgi:PAS domain S-box-containing protein